jgi:hypothetical protein
MAEEKILRVNIFFETCMCFVWVCVFRGEVVGPEVNSEGLKLGVGKVVFGMADGRSEGWGGGEGYRLLSSTTARACSVALEGGDSV